MTFFESRCSSLRGECSYSVEGNVWDELPGLLPRTSALRVPLISVQTRRRCPKKTRTHFPPLIQESDVLFL